MDFVVPGPGAKDGIRKCFRDTGHLTEADIIRLMADVHEEQFARLGLRFRSLWGRRLQLIDCQNLFCEVSKYARCVHLMSLAPVAERESSRGFMPTLSRCGTGFRRNGG